MLLTCCAAPCSDDGNIADKQAGEDFGFTDGDTDISWDGDSAHTITLKDGASAASGGNVSIDGDVVTITSPGEYVVTGELSDGQLVVDVTRQDKVRLVLSGVSVSCSNSAALYVKSADKVFVTLDRETVNRLSGYGGFSAEAEKAGIDAAVYSKDDITFNSWDGVLEVYCDKGHAIASSNDIVIAGGTYRLNAANDGLHGKDCVKLAKSELDIISGGDGIQSDNDEEEDKGYVYIRDGSVRIASGDKAVTAERHVRIDGGTVDIVKSGEGIEGESITINGGSLSVISADDGINAASQDKSDAADDTIYIMLNGGDVSIDAGGDGIDSNGWIFVTGGTLLISGSADDENGAMDYDGEAVISGGTVIAAGSHAEAQGFSSADGQGALIYKTERLSGGTRITLCEPDGAVILTWAPYKDYSGVVMSSPDITADGEYMLYSGGEIYDGVLTGGEKADIG